MKRYRSCCIMHALWRLYCLMILFANSASNRWNASWPMMFIQYVHWMSWPKRAAFCRIKRLTAIPKSFCRLGCAFVDSPLWHSRRCNHAGAWRDANRVIGCFEKIAFEVVGVLVCFFVNLLLAQVVGRAGKLGDHTREVYVAKKDSTSFLCLLGKPENARKLNLNTKLKIEARKPTNERHQLESNSTVKSATLAS